MQQYIISFFAALIPFVALDASWLMTMSQKFYSPHLSHLLSENPKLFPALIFYLVFTLGLLVFVITPAITLDYSATKLLVLGALFGAVTYATYDLTNQATLKNWPVVVTLVDILWGSLITSAVSYISVYITKYFI